MKNYGVYNMVAVAEGALWMAEWWIYEKPILFMTGDCPDSMMMVLKKWCLYRRACLFNNNMQFISKILTVIVKLYSVVCCLIATRSAFNVRLADFTSGFRLLTEHWLYTHWVALGSLLLYIQIYIYQLLYNCHLIIAPSFTPWNLATMIHQVLYWQLTTATEHDNQMMLYKIIATFTSCWCLNQINACCVLK
jgi:hypothetical protein